MKVDEGVIKDIVWDNQCYSCEENKCVKNIKAYNLYNSSIIESYSNCQVDVDVNNNQSYLYDPKFYLTWFGTDKDKRQMKSANLAMSKFKQYSISSLYESVKDSFTVGEDIVDPKEINKTIEEILKNV